MKVFNKAKKFQIAIDTIVLNIKKCVIAPDANLHLESKLATKTGESLSKYPLWQDSLGNWNYGQKAYYNDPNGHFTFEISPIFKKIVTKVTIQVPRVCSNSKLNIHCASKSDLRNAVKIVENKLKRAGIECDLTSGSISRIDIFRDIPLGNRFAAYSPILEFLFKSLGDHYISPNSFSVRKENYSLKVYNKREQLLRKGTKALPFGGDVARFELSIHSKAQVQSELKVETLDDLFNNYKIIQKVFKKRWRSTFISINPLTTMNSFSDFPAVIDFYKRKYSDKYKSRFLKHAAFAFLNLSGADMEQVAAELSMDGAQSKEAIYRRKRRIMKEAGPVMGLLNLFKRKNTQSPLKALYKELRTKLFSR